MIVQIGEENDRIYCVAVRSQASRQISLRAYIWRKNPCFQVVLKNDETRIAGKWEWPQTGAAKNINVASK